MIERLLSRFVSRSDLRARKAVKHILYATGLKFINAGISFIIVPLYLNYLTELSFGIWLTVSAVLNWFNFLDLGMGNGLRNRFAEARAADNNTLAAIYVSTTYALLTIIAGAGLVVFLLLYPFVNWSVLFAAPPQLTEEVNLMILVLVVLFAPQFVLQLIKMVLTADQRPALTNVMNTAVNVLHLGVLFILDIYFNPSLWVLALAIGAVNLLVPLMANIYFFLGTYRPFAPVMSLVRWQESRNLLGLGFVFFVLQGAALVVFMTDNLIITHVLGPEEVPSYNIAYRYFNLAAVFFGLLTAPFWSAFTEAYAKGDMEWIKRVISKLFRVWFFMLIGVILMVFIAPWVYKTWIGDELHIPQVLSIAMALWVVLSALTSIFGTFLSGTGKLRLSLYHAVLVMIINIPLSIWLAKFPALGSAGVILASLFGVLLRLFFQPAQTYRIISGTAKGIWSK